MVSNHQPHDCLLNRLFRRRSKKTSKLRDTSLCAGNSPVTGEFPEQRPVTRKMLPFDDVIMTSGHIRQSRPRQWINEVLRYHVRVFVQTHVIWNRNDKVHYLMIILILCNLQTYHFNIHGLWYIGNRYDLSTTKCLNMWPIIRFQSSEIVMSVIIKILWSNTYINNHPNSERFCVMTEQF